MRSCSIRAPKPGLGTFLAVTATMRPEWVATILARLLAPLTEATVIPFE
jgi:hypothetical protein